MYRINKNVKFNKSLFFQMSNFDISLKKKYKFKKKITIFYSFVLKALMIAFILSYVPVIHPATPSTKINTFLIIVIGRNSPKL